ncbi:MAG: replication-associated recombination protein A [Bacteroidales bacterium]|jgi:putative ATPase|nr:replication-associated recombination protein A [Bacteroidales bacterium]MCI2122509.1 replication-associated recombination protein A [Bacteroidales bacterium]MCI2144790.1 replication-associated recombination protein A [Bacteroidales bacterium]
MIGENVAPLAERMRPTTLDDYVGQKHLVGPGCVLRKMIETGNLSSFILWGPPGVGKTTLAKIIAKSLDREFYTLSAISSGVKDVREVIGKAKGNRMFAKAAPILFIDEIHRFNKAQQDALLGAVEDGTVVLIGATTENPSFEVISPLLSRCQTFVLNPLENSDLDILLKNALQKDEVLRKRKITVRETDAMYRYAGGDARKFLNIIDIIASSFAPDKEIIIDNKLVTEKLQENLSYYDKNGEQHYDVISAFIKSMRGSDPNAAVYWLARMIAGGEDPLFIARRMVILASEDIGLANPNALLLAEACFNAVHEVGMPEAQLVLSETCVYLASSPKSNSTYRALQAALNNIRENGEPPVPLHLRNAVTNLMKDLDYGKDYKYAHDFEGNFVNLEFLPEGVEGTKFYDPGDNHREKEIRARLAAHWKKYGY